MSRRIDPTRPPALWLERLVWNAAAGAALAVMIAVLLGALRVLDAVSAAPIEVGEPAAPPPLVDARPLEVAPSAAALRPDEGRGSAVVASASR